ncbi:MAG: ATP-binding cassette domain-containing protein [Deltaproteobacteria bacterium]|nr:ATP-binding cassette domain-containing protein [Deltaproteobacteria bacterium]
MIAIHQVEKVFHVGEGGVAALRGVQLQMEPEEFFVLLGPSGSGKTTLLRCVAGLERPDGGEIHLGTRLIFSSAQGVFVPPEERGLGMVFQSYAVWPHMNVFDNVALPLTHGAHRLSKDLVKKRVRQALIQVQLEGLEERPVPLLSGGQQQRVALARALAVEPSVLLMDEPLSNLDARLREEVRSEIRAVAKKVGVAVLYVTHDQSEAMALADRIAVMDSGRIIQIGSPTMLYENPANPRVAEFFGSINWLGGEVREKGQVTTSLGVIHADTPNGLAAVRIGIRPESLGLTDHALKKPNEFQGQLVERTFLGDHQELRVRVDSEVLLIKKLRTENFSVERKECYVQFPREELMVFPTD